jgi:drug/metabolite transporter (DMT)-like permease
LIAIARRAGHWVFDQAFLLLALTMLMWGGNAVAGKLAVGQMSPMVIVCLRWVFVCLVLGVTARRQLRADWPVLRGHLTMVIFSGMFGFTVFNALFYEAAHYTTAVNMTILQGAIPVLVLIGAALAYRTTITLVQWIGVFMTLGGVAAVASQGHLETLTSLQFNIGDLWLLIACLFYAAYTVALRRRPKVSGTGFFAAMAVVACLTSLPLLASEIAQGTVQWPTPKGWAILLFVGIGPSLLAQIFFMRAVELIGPGRAALFANLVPVFGAGLAVMLLDEQFHLYHAVSLVLVLGGIFVAERLGRRT